MKKNIFILGLVAVAATAASCSKNNDKDGDGIIYEISNETTGDLEWVDEDGYQFWYNNLFGDEPPLDIPWKTLDEFVHPNG